MSFRAIFTTFTIVLVLSTATQAQIPQGSGGENKKENTSRGGFLKRIREEFSGRRQDDEKKEKGDADRRQSGDADREPTPATRPSDRSDGLFNAPWLREDSALTDDEQKSTPPPFRFSQQFPHEVQLAAPQSSRTNEAAGWVSDETAQSHRNKSNSRNRQSKGPPRKGFGLKLGATDDGLIVEYVDPRGNAQEAGLKKGDVILKIGGIEIKTLDEYDGIAGVMKDGDQIQVEYARRGENNEVAMQYGQAAETDEPTENASLAADLDPSTAASIQDNRLEPRSAVPDFAPPRADDSSDPELLPPSNAGKSVMEPNSVGQRPNHQDGFRLPPPNTQPSSYSTEQLLRTIQQQQEIIRQLQMQVEQLQRQNQNKRGSSRSGR